MKESNIDYKVVVIGSGHAGIEAACGAARVLKTYGTQNSKVCLVTVNEENIGEMSCNPAIGGIGKGVIVREIDALDGIMGKAADMAGIHFRILNQKKGPAVWGPRCQADRKLYKKAVKKLLSEYDNLDIKYSQVQDIEITDSSIGGIILADGNVVKCSSVVLTTGTFLSGMILIGQKRIPAGRINEKPSYGLSTFLANNNFELGRLKTGTPARLLKDSINFSILEKQESEASPTPFSYLNNKITNEQISCYITYTNQNTHDIILQNKEKSPILMKEINAKGPRYCPSIEDKITRFSDKESHRIFLEPEGLDSELVYPNGISTAISEDVQEQFIRSMKGLENVIISQYGYAIEYDYVNPQELLNTLETKKIKGLFLAGQINGTTGYEEAAGQGIIAGINAGLKACNANQTLTTDRSESYIGVMIEDLILKGIKEPYRMFTSRSEYRINIRSDNADLRLTQKIIDLNICSKERKMAFENKLEQVSSLKTILKSKSFTPNELKAINPDFVVSYDGIKKNGIEMLSNHNFKSNDVYNLFSEVDINSTFNQNIREIVEIESKYLKYIERQKKDIDLLEKEKCMQIPEWVNFYEIDSISSEVKDILNKLKPQNLSQVQQLQGITPAAVIALIIYIREQKAKQNI